MVDWNKLNEKDKALLARHKITFIAGSISLTKKRIQELYKTYSNQFLLFGCLKDDEIPGLEDSLQFTPLRYENLEKFLSQSKRKCVEILRYFYKDCKYIIQELKPSQVIFINGSWSGQIHYRSEYWEALNCGAKVTLVSPFQDESDAHTFEQKIYKSTQKQKLFKYNHHYSDTELMEICTHVSIRSWDWIGQIGALLIKDHNIVLSAHNRVLPYEAYQMFAGSIREKKFTPAQEVIETQLTNHAECEILEYARREHTDLKGTSLYINIFPCPVCAKILARTDIKEIVYTFDHNLGNDIGYKILEKCGKKLKRVMI